MTELEGFMRIVALVVLTLVPIVNPTGIAPIFLSMTPGASASTRRLLARKIGINIVLLLAAAMFIGSHILGFFGLSLAVVKIAGGMLVIANGWLPPRMGTLLTGVVWAATLPAEKASTVSPQVSWR